MTSACVKKIGMSPENFLDCPAGYPTYGMLSPGISFSREDSSTAVVTDAGGAKSTTATAERKAAKVTELSDPEDGPVKEAGDFEFRPSDPVAMLTADELFSDGKLLPLQLSAARPETASEPVPEEEGVRSPVQAGKYCRRNDVLGAESYLFSPKAPRCAARWRELLGLRKSYQNTSHGGAKQEFNKSATSSSPSAKPKKHFLQRSFKSMASPPSSADVEVPLLKDSDFEPAASLSPRLSLSSSSPGHDHDDPFRPPPDSDKPNLSQPAHPTIARSSSGGQNQNPNPFRVRLVKTPVTRRAQQEQPTTVTAQGLTVDSPRIKSSGKIVFQSLERSSSSPSSFNGGPRYRDRGMERSYSANVRIAHVLNVPVCSLRGSSKSSGVFGLFSSQLQKKDGNDGCGGISKNLRRHHHHHHQTGTSNSSSSKNK
ncbi:hypothetical protein Nepgr_027468 [Nepenthes gracilis]|uniref:Uncharacterized protein n=1 Tax=Nepenthes gracilis TaxID=150966 RepID=A0AAD3T8K6_NEPGR|nr:hypothetical protein Nepgr_027468 [Nepenthes gracilis]